MLTLEYAKDPIWVTKNANVIALIVKWQEFNEEMPFNACSYDTEQYGVDLFNRAVAGEFGEIAPYVPPPEPVV